MKELLKKLFGRDERDYEIWEDQEELLTKIIAIVSASTILLLVLVLTLVMLVSCRSIKNTEYVTVHDTLTINNSHRDSIFMHDSIYMREYSRGDTVYIISNRWHTKYKDRYIHDSVYIHKTDTLTVNKTVEKHNSFIDNIKLSAAILSVFAIIMFFVKLLKKT